MYRDNIKSQEDYYSMKYTELDEEEYSIAFSTYYFILENSAGDNWSIWDLEVWISKQLLIGWLTFREALFEYNEYMKTYVPSEPPTIIDRKCLIESII
jgi:hypothetical protein